MSAATPPGERIEILDVIRGFALVGVLLVNMQYFVEPSYAQVLRDEGWGLPDRLGLGFVDLLALSKFYPIFSFLFGYGAALQMGSAVARGTGFAGLYAWRMTLLLLIGAHHAIYVWNGDILATYALLGYALLLFRKASDRTLLATSAGLVLAATAVLAGLRLALDAGLLAPDAAAEIERRFAASAEPWRRVGRQTLLVMGMFLLGFWAGRRGLFSDAPPAHPGRLRRLVALALGIGLAGNLAYVALEMRVDPAALTWSWVAAVTLLAVCGPLLGAGYVGGLVLLFPRPGWRRRLSPLAAVGRTALTNYLLQSLVCLALVGQHGPLSPLHPPAGVALTFAIFAVQVALSRWWLRRYRFGPVEWLWRSATYARWQPLRG